MLVYLFRIDLLQPIKEPAFLATGERRAAEMWRWKSGKIQNFFFKNLTIFLLSQNCSIFEKKILYFTWFSSSHLCRSALRLAVWVRWTVRFRDIEGFILDQKTIFRLDHDVNGMFLTEAQGALQLENFTFDCSWHAKYHIYEMFLILLKTGHDEAYEKIPSFVKHRINSQKIHRTFKMACFWLTTWKRFKLIS